MKLEDSIEETAIRVCDEIACAIERYASMSGEGAEDMPESFLGACVFTNLGPVLTMTLETNSTKLWAWNADARRRWNNQPDAPLPRQPADYKAKVGVRRVDLAIFQGDHTRKSETTFLCLVEFKKWWPSDDDVQKLRDWFPFIDTCPYGICCCFARVDDDTFRCLQENAERDGDIWVAGRLARPLADAANYRTFARVLRNPHYRPGRAAAT